MDVGQQRPPGAEVPSKADQSAILEGGVWWCEVGEAGLGGDLLSAVSKSKSMRRLDLMRERGLHFAISIGSRTVLYSTLRKSKKKGGKKKDLISVLICSLNVSLSPMNGFFVGDLPL